MSSDRADGAEQRGDAIEPDGRAGIANADSLGGTHHTGLEPVDADRFLVADLVLEADVDIVAAFDHLLGRLREARLVAVDRRDVEGARQERDERDQDQNGDRARVRRRRNSEQRTNVLCQRSWREPRDHVPAHSNSRGH